MIVTFNPGGARGIGDGFLYVFPPTGGLNPPSGAGDESRLQLGYVRETFLSSSNPNIGGF